MHLEYRLLKGNGTGPKDGKRLMKQTASVNLVRPTVMNSRFIHYDSFSLKTGPVTFTVSIKGRAFALLNHHCS